MNEIKDRRIKLFDCKNGHITENMKLEEYRISQNIDLSKIKCDKCLNQNKAITYKNQFFVCIKCQMNLCPLCKEIHDSTNSIINYDIKDYI